MSEPGHERFDIPHADILDEDVWADEDESRRCRACDAELSANERRCPRCGVLVPVCVGACAACISPVWVGEPER